MRPSLVLLALAVAAPSFAQTAVVVPPSPAITRLWTLERDSSQLEAFAQPLLDSVGPRLTGSPGLRSAQDYIISRYAAWGIGAKRVDYGTWRSWKRGATHVDLLTPRVRSLEAMMLAWSPGTGGRNVDGDVIAMPAFTTAADFQSFLATVKGKFVLVSVPQPSCRPDTTWVQNGQPLTSRDFARRARRATATSRAACAPQASRSRSPGLARARRRRGCLPQHVERRLGRGPDLQRTHADDAAHRCQLRGFRPARAPHRARPARARARERRELVPGRSAGGERDRDDPRRREEERVRHAQRRTSTVGTVRAAPPTTARARS